MELDDSLDSELTELGREQARNVRTRLCRHDGMEDKISSPPLFDLVVSSPLSRAIQTADLAVPKEFAPNRVLYESFRRDQR